MPQSAIVPGILGGLGLISQSNANKEAQNHANAQLALQQQMEQAQLGSYNNYMSDVGRLQEQGAFNPAARLQELNQQAQYDLKNALSSEAGAARALGYRPGDSVPITQMNQTMGDYQLQQQQAANQIMNQSNANYLAAMQGAPSLSDLGSGIGASSENARMYLGQEASPMGMLGAVGQYLQGNNQQNQPSLAAGVAPSQWNWSYDPFSHASGSSQTWITDPNYPTAGSPGYSYVPGENLSWDPNSGWVDTGSGTGGTFAYDQAAAPTRRTPQSPQKAVANTPSAPVPQSPASSSVFGQLSQPKQSTQSLPSQTNALSDSSANAGGFGGVGPSPRTKGYGVFSAL